MDRRLLQPRWMVAHAVVLVLAVIFVFLGFWQLRRHAERVELNEVGRARLSTSVADFDSLLAQTGDLENLTYRRVEVTGEYMPADQVLVRSQVYQGRAGFHVVTPLIPADGRAVLVNRGWVPLEFEQLPDETASPPAGAVSIEGWIQLTEERPPLGPEDPAEGVLGVVNRVDIDRIGQQLPVPLAPVYLVLIEEQGERLPVPLAPPTFDDQGPHLAYAVQWFGFTAVGVVGYFFLVRRRLGLSTRGRLRG